MSPSSPASLAPILSLQGVRKSFRGREALKGVSLELRRGELLGFFGPNGAGKTTMIRCISGLLEPDAGTIQRRAADADADASSVRLGLVTQNLSVYPDLTVRQNLEVFGRLEGVARPALQQRIVEVLEWAALQDRTRCLARNLSGGMQRRLNIACSVLHEPDILLLDEPTVGVDPQSRERIYEMLGDLKDQGAAVLLTTHQLEEVETRCDRVVVMDQGVIVADGELDDLVQRTLGRRHRVVLTFHRPCDRSVAAFEFNEGRTTATSSAASMAELSQILSMLKHLEPAPDRIEVSNHGLQDVFLELTGRSLRE